VVMSGVRGVGGWVGGGGGGGGGLEGISRALVHDISGSA
jgi:hypothetical protein